MLTRIKIDEIPPAGLRLQLNETVAGNPRYSGLEASADIAFLSPLQVEVVLVRIREMVEMSGLLRSRIATVCSRCLIPLEVDLEARFQLMYARRPGLEADHSLQKEIELTTEDVGLMLFDDDMIDISQGIYEEALAALPLKNLCHDDCRGLCLNCGADLNREACCCTKEHIDPRLAKLKGLILKNLPEE